MIAQTLVKFAKMNKMWGNLTTSTLVAVMSALTASAFAREITELSVDAENSTATVTLGEAAAGGETNAVYYVWTNDGVDRGTDIASWPNVVRLGIVDETDAERTFNLATPEYPTGQYAARAFLATTSRVYDYFVEGLKSHRHGCSRGDVLHRYGLLPCR